MNKMLILYILLLQLCINTALAAPEKTTSIDIVQPSNSVILREEKALTLVIELIDLDIDSIIIGTDENETITIKTVVKKNYYCQNIKLHLGENVLTVTGVKSGKVVKKLERQIYVKSKVHKAYRYPPTIYIKSPFHTQKKERVCAKCHDMSVNEVPNEPFENISESNCFQCHMSINSDKYVHAPSANWLCTSCHIGKTDHFNNKNTMASRFVAPDPIENLCLDCHEKKKKLWKNRRYKHEPAESGRCTKCHNPHASNSENHLRKPVWELCTGCHKEKINGKHIITTFNRKIHPTHDVKDPSREGKELSCVSCHNPHISDIAYMLRGDSFSAFCGRCHKK